MPKKYGVKEKDLVIAHIVNQLFTGKLRSGDRVDRNEITRDLRLSRVPIQEAVVQLERDGVVSTQYHRGAYIERFDESVVREQHELYGLLSGAASARAAANPDNTLLNQLETQVVTMQSSKEDKAFHAAARQYRRSINHQYAGPRLLAALNASRDLIPEQFWASYLSNSQEMLTLYEAETAAIRDRDPEAARSACAARADVMARIMLGELVRRGVLRPAGEAQPTAGVF